MRRAEGDPSRLIDGPGEAAPLLRVYRSETRPRELPGADAAAWRTLSSRLGGQVPGSRPRWSPAALAAGLAATCLGVFLFAATGSHPAPTAGRLELPRAGGYGGASGGEPGTGGARGAGGGPGRGGAGPTS